MRKKQLSTIRKIKPQTLLIGIVVLVLLVLTCFKVYVDNARRPVHRLEYFPQEKAVTISQTDNLLSAKPVIKSKKSVGLIFYGGERIDGTCYYPLMMALAAKGYECYLPTTFGNLPFLNIEGAEYVIRTYPDIKTWFIVAHSEACETAARYAKAHTKELDGLVYLGGYSTKTDLSQTNLKILSIHGSRDTIFRPETFEKAKSNDSKGAAYQTINGGNNSGFADCGLRKKDTEATMDAKEQIKKTAEFIDEFLINSKEVK